MQIPNFVLAMPMLYISFAGCYEYFSQDWTRSVQLGLLPTYASSALRMKLQSQKTRAPKHLHLMAPKALCTQAPKGFNSDDVAPYIHQWAVMTACALFVMNVQVATRYVTNSVVTDAFSLCQDEHHRCPSVTYHHRGQSVTKVCRAGFCQRAQQYTGMQHLVSGQKGGHGCGDIFSPTSVQAAFCLHFSIHGHNLCGDVYNT